MNVKKVTKENIIKTAAKKNRCDLPTVRSIYNTIEDIIFDSLAAAEEDAPVVIKLFEGITLETNYIPEKTKQNNLTGNVSSVKSHLKPKASFTRSYREKLNSEVAQ